MNDRELLEMAAKAIGYRTTHAWNRERLELDPPVQAMVVFDSSGELVTTGWNPLDNDGQALRLAVRLRMCVSVEHDAQAAVWRGDDLVAFNEPLGDDECAAVRLAVLRCAAEIGRAMP